MIGIVEVKARNNSFCNSVDTMSENIVSVDKQSNEPYQFKSAHVFGLVLNSFVWILLISYLIFVVFLVITKKYDFFDHNSIIFFICFCVIYLIYAIEVLTSTTFKVLMKKRKLSKVEKYIQTLQIYEPIVRFQSESYHYPGETNDLKEHQKIRRRLFSNRKIITSRNKHDFRYNFCEDNSDKMLEAHHNHVLIKFKLESHVAFGDTYTENHYYQKLEEFTNSNRDLDIHYKLDEIKQVETMKTEIIAINDDATPFIYSAFCFMLVSLLLFMSWPYRVWLQSKFAKSHFRIGKIIYCDPKSH